MKALYYDGTLSIREVPEPSPAPGEALIRVLIAGICNTDLEIIRGYMGFQGILGHEFVGIVEKAANPYLLGKRVVGEINCPCGNCRFCRMEMPGHCPERSVLGISGRPGAFAEYLCLPEANLHLVPDSVSDDAASFTEPLAAAFRIIDQLSPSSEDQIIVLGDGKLAQLITQTMWLHSKHTVCLGKHDWKLSLLRDLGISTQHFGTYQGDMADVVIEATGRPEGLNHALRLIRPEGTIILKTTCHDNSSFDAARAVVNEIRIQGSRCGPFRPALEALALGTVEVHPLITEVFSLEEGLQAFERAARPETMKILLQL
ncbi:MAG: alcohol dehydrogenase catalytic domain-containing protein [Candidatus Hydrogenedens sp.]|jgi:threonine dehydrogenase-like Zn-dependent dehydrogenase|nr:alcohol dehydrogenase catalytic domain-containing protein [Candidatus Hydrogenedens sp.]